VKESLLFGVLLLVAIGLWLAIQRAYGRAQRRRRWARSQAAELEAPRLLRDLGYEVLGAQVPGKYTLIVDGEPISFALRADYLVERNDLTYVAEVKSGKLAPRLNHGSTRRQLLEYLIAFQTDGVLLVDGETQRVHEVVFPIASREPPAQTKLVVLPLVLAIVFITAVVAIFFLY
jgi:hypothetical protein